FSPDAAFCPFDGVRLAPASFDPLADPLIGTTIDGRYEPVEMIGEGGMGRVYRVRHVSLERTFAMKVLRRELAIDDELAMRFVREAKATAAIKHPNIVQITDFGVLSNSVPYFVMELLVGRTLRGVLRKGPIPRRHALPILRQLASGLDAAHQAGIIHRDLKPENVFLTDAESVTRLVDFGASRIVGASRMTRGGVVFGTPYYMSPEQAAGLDVDCRADVYSLGVIMYETLTGRRPFEGDSYMGVLAAHMFDQPPRPSQVNPTTGDLGPLDGIVLRCMAKAPENRFASMQEVLGELDRACAAVETGPERLGRTAHPSAWLDGSSSSARSRSGALVPRRLGGSLLRSSRKRRPSTAGWIALGVMAVVVLGAVARWRATSRSTSPGGEPDVAGSVGGASERSQVEAPSPPRSAKPVPPTPGSPLREFPPQASQVAAAPPPNSPLPAPSPATGASVAPPGGVSPAAAAPASGSTLRFRRPTDSAAQEGRRSGRVLDDIGDPFTGRP
ncbi:MAG TPA: serine/threonine-protein kinase, partial [Polyangiaceae bacterium]|nr:serine/threonine-protein kinase [Polyangiaceae bacterium]